MVSCHPAPCNESHGLCYSDDLPHIAVREHMKPCSAIVFGLCVMSCLTPSIFAGSTLDSSLSSGNWLTTALDQISAERMLADVTALSGPTYRGRQTGSAQD